MELDPLPNFQNAAIAHAPFVVRGLEARRAVEQHHRAHVLHADVWHVAVIDRVRALMGDPHHEIFDIIRS